MSAFISLTNCLEKIQTVNSVNEHADFPLANALNDHNYQFWQPSVTGNASFDVTLSSTEVFDYFAIHGHKNLVGSTLTIERYTTQFSPVDSFVIVSEKTVFKRFNRIQTNRIRVTITNVTNAEVSNIAMGEALELSELRTPFTPPPVAHSEYLVNNESAMFNPLGHIRRKKPFDFTINQTMVKQSWLDANYQKLVERVSRPFFFTWNDQPDGACYCWLTDEVEPPQHNHYLWQDFYIRARGLMT